MAVIRGNGSDNLLVGGATGDLIFGYGGADTLLGNGGRDTLFGGAGDDLLDGGAQRDVMNGGIGTDTVTYAANTTILDIDLATGVVSFFGQDWAPERLVSIEGVIGGSGDDNIYGNAARNILRGGAGDDEIDGRVGADALFGGWGDDAISGGSGSDTIEGGAGSDALYGDSFDDDVVPPYLDVSNALAIALHKPDTVSYARETAALTFVLGARWAEAVMSLEGSNDVDSVYGFDNVLGGAGADRITGNDGDNRLEGGRGNDTLTGGAGDDTLIGNAGTDRMRGGAGSDWVDYSENTNAVRLNLSTQSVTFPGKPWAPESLASIENALTGSGNDTLYGNGAANVLDGGLGSDRINGAGGSDTVSYRSHASAVSVDLARGIGTIIGTSVRDTLYGIENATGGAGNDRLHASASGSVLDGGAGNDTATGGAGNDTIYLTAGSDVITGGAGSDTVVLDFGYDDYPGLTYSEYWDYVDEVYPVTYDGDSDADLLVDLADGSVVSYDGPSVSGTLTGIENVTTGAGNDVVTGSAAANVISVGHGANLVNAGRGNDVIYGSNTQTEWQAWADNADRAVFIDERDAHELLRGGLGADTIVGGMSMFGQGGDDRLVAALVPETTRMSGGAGADTFEFSDNARVVGDHEWYVQAERATIADFSRDEGDRIVIRHADAGTPDPTFVGTVTDRSEVDVGEWGFLDGKIFIPRDYDVFEDTETPAGLEIEIVGGNITEEDVFFV